MNFVARVDALGAIADLKINTTREAAFALENRHADVLSDTRVDRGLVDHDRTRLEVLTQGLRRTNHGS